MIRMRVLVTGGSGALGSLVVSELRWRGHEARPASRRTGFDLATGAGVDAAVAGVEAVVHCATRPQNPRQVDVGGTGRLVAAAARQPVVPHLVYISIVGCDLNPFPYYRAKTEVEHRLRQWGGPVTVVRATQFHPLAAAITRLLTLGPVTLSVGDMAVQPVDTNWVASRLVDVATEPAPQGFSRTGDLAGPDVLATREIAAMLSSHAGRAAPRVVRVPPVGGVMRAFSDRTNLPRGGAEVGGRSFAQWLEGQPR
jgi:uncharacterized protein YbjT (DUF2867 family)